MDGDGYSYREDDRYVMTQRALTFLALPLRRKVGETEVDAEIGRRVSAGWSAPELRRHLEVDDEEISGRLSALGLGRAVSGRADAWRDDGIARFALATEGWKPVRAAWRSERDAVEAMDGYVGRDVVPNIFASFQITKSTRALVPKLTAYLRDAGRLPRPFEERREQAEEAAFVDLAGLGWSVVEIAGHLGWTAVKTRARMAAAGILVEHMPTHDEGRDALMPRFVVPLPPVPARFSVSDRVTWLIDSGWSRAEINRLGKTTDEWANPSWSFADPFRRARGLHNRADRLRDQGVDLPLLLLGEPERDNNGYTALPAARARQSARSAAVREQQLIDEACGDLLEAGPPPVHGPDVPGTAD